MAPSHGAPPGDQRPYPRAPRPRGPHPRTGHLRERAPGLQGLHHNAEKALAANYAVGDVVAFHRPYKRIGVAKGDERRVVGVNHRAREVVLEGRDGGTVAWKPGEIGGRRGGSEVYRTEGIELRAGDRIRWTRNDAGLGLVNSRTAEVMSVANGRVSFRLEDGRKLELGRNDPQLRHLDHSWASTVHAFQGRTVDNVIAAMEAQAPASHYPEELLCRDQPGARPGRAGHRRCSRAPGPASGRQRRTHRGARRHRRDEARGAGKGCGGRPERRTPAGERSRTGRGQGP